MSTDFGQRLKSARSLAGLTQAQLGRQAGMGQSTIADLERGGSGTSKTATLASLCGVSALWLECGKGPMSADAAALQRQLPQGTRRYPLLGLQQAGGRSAEDAMGDADDEHFLGIEVASDNASPRAFFVRLEDNAMAPEIREGDRVLIDPALPPRPGDCVLATDSRQQAILRKYRVRGLDKAGAEIFELVPLNEDHPTLCSDEQALQLRGTVVEHRRRLQAR
ncbi:MAG: LexA family protein [Delftia tsuruhatensis]